MSGEVPLFRYQGLVYRAHNPKWFSTPASGAGAMRRGGRFNRVGAPALYASLDPKTAWMEAQQGFPFKPQPMTLVAYEVNCADIVDLSDPDVRAALKVSVSDLACAWEDMASLGAHPPTWTLADRLIDEGVAAVIVQSFAPGCGPDDRNLVFWTWSENPPHQVSAIDDYGRISAP